MNDMQRLALAYAPSPLRGALAALWDYDVMLGRVVATTTSPMIGQMRLTWWHDRILALADGHVAREPLITALSDVYRDHDVSAEALAVLVEGWEALLEPLPLADAALHDFANMRGERLFGISAQILGKPVAPGLGAGWALIDFATHCSDPATRARAWAMAGARFAATPTRGPKPLRFLARIARAKATQPFGSIGAPVARVLLLRAALS